MQLAVHCSQKTNRPAAVTTAQYLCMGLCIGCFPASLPSQASEPDSLLDQFRHSFNTAYNEKVNAAHFKVALVDAASLSSMLSIYHTENKGFPDAVEETQFSGYSEHVAEEIQLNAGGAFRMNLSDIFGDEKYIAMEPVFQGKDILRWKCHSNVAKAVLQDTFCQPVEP